MTDTNIDLVEEAKRQHQAAVERLEALRAERKRLSNAIAEAVTREAYLRRVATSTQPRTRKSKASENGEPQ